MSSRIRVSTLLFVLSLSAVLLTVVSAEAQTIFINEIHYDNTGADADEGVEIAGPAGTDLTGWRVRLYNGTDGTAYGVIVLSGNIPDNCNGYGALWFPELGVQNGSPDGLALVDDAGAVLQFLSYEGAILATSNEANGMTSTDIGVTEDSSTPVGYSLQLVGIGSEYGDFTWAAAAPSSHDACNPGEETPTAVGGPAVKGLSIFAYPNPFNPETTIQYVVPSQGQVTVAIYDAHGSRINTIVREEKAAGTYSARWMGTDASGHGVGSGVYFLRIEHGGVTQSEKIVLLK